MKYKTIFIICSIISLLAGRKTNAQSITFTYIGSMQTWTVPSCVFSITIDCYGAQGVGVRNEIHIGFGGEARGVLAVTPGQVYNIFVGGQAAWNGGGVGQNGANGGDASDVRYPGASLADRLIVAGGGGGSGGDNWQCLAGVSGSGGDGIAVGTNFMGGGGGMGYGGCGTNGATNGGLGYLLNCHGGGAGGGGMVSGGQGSEAICGPYYGVNGTLGQGGAAYFAPLCSPEGTGGGGGGYYGGGGTSGYNCGGGEGGGGSSWTGSLTSPYFYTNLWTGNGEIIITYGTGFAPLIVTPSIQTNPTCGVCNGIINLGVTGGGSPYTYSWAPTGQTTQTATGLCANTYTITVTDSCGDVTTASIVLTANSLTAFANVNSNEKCNGDCTGSATGTVGIGSPPYTYSWAPSGGTKALATGLCAGIYTLTVTDINGCTGTATALITQPSQLMANISPLTYPLCNGGTGTATADPSGGISPYTYLWVPGGQTNALATGLSARTYTVTITDNNGCTATAAATITQPTQVTAITNVTANILCNGGTGSATVSAAGGVLPYTYLWNPSAQTNALATGLSAGVYTVNVTDNNGCTETASITITQPAVLTATMSSIIHSSCNLANGAATVSVTGGTLPYFYIWSPGGQTKAQATDLGVGTYTVDVTDHNGCTASAMATITQPTLVTAVITATTNITCYNGNNGAITVKANGGSLPYTYLWTPSNYTTASPNNLFALTYTVTVTDANGCTATETTTLTQPAQLAVSITEPKTICKDSTGNILGNVTGGISPYTYVWSGGNTSVTSTATITPIATNNYSVEVTDNNGCTASTNIILKYGPNLFVNITGKNSVCSGYTTTICASVTGGQGGNFYVWSPSNNTNACITVTPGITSTYTVQVVDGCGATTTANTTLYTNSSPVINMSADVVQGCVPLCIQFHNATTLSKGNITQYIWNFGNKDTAQSMSPVYCYANSGSYNVSLTAITDSGCSATLDKVNMITVYKHPNAAFTYSPQDVNIETPEVQFTDESTDASGIAYWMWNFGDLSNSTSALQNPIHTYKDTGNFCADLIVMDNHGCTDTATNCLVIGSAFKLYIPSAFTPNGDGMDDIFIPVGKYIKNFEMSIFDRWGIELYHSTNINEGWNGTANGVTSISQEDVYVYKIMVTDAEDTQHSYVGKVTLIK